MKVSNIMFLLPTTHIQAQMKTATALDSAVDRKPFVPVSQNYTGGSIIPHRGYFIARMSSF